MRLRRRLPRPDPAVVRATADALTAAEVAAAEADAAHRFAHCASAAAWAEVPRSERPPEDVRTALARQAAAVEYERLVFARAGVERARRAYYAAREGR